MRTRLMMAIGIAGMAILSTAGAVPAGAAAPAAAEEPPLPDLPLVGLQPHRVLDTRATGDPLQAMERRCVSIAGTPGLPADATAIVVTLTVTQPQQAGYLSANGFTGPVSTNNTSTLNFAAGETVANSATFRIVTKAENSFQANQVCVVSTAATHLLIDVNAAFSESSGVGMYLPISPSRLDDTRVGAPVPAGTVHEITVAGRGRVPADADAVAVNLTVIDPDAAGYATLFPCGSNIPEVSNANFVASQTIAAGAVVKVGEGGKVCYFSSATTDLALDVNAAYSPTAGTDTVYPIVLDMYRTGASQPSKVPAGTSFRVVIRGRNGVPNRVTALVANVTIDAPEAAGHATVYPCGQSVPEASNLNFVRGDTVANSVNVPVGPEGDVCVFTTANAYVMVDQTFVFVPEE